MNNLGEIICLIVFALFIWIYKKQDFEHLQEALRQAETQKQKDTQCITVLQSQLEVQRQELERIKAINKRFAMSNDAFRKLCGSGSAEKVEEAIIIGADVNSEDKDGWTALMVSATSAMKGSIETAEVLLKHGADVNAKDKWDGRTALMQAAYFRRQIEIVELLLKYGADVNAKNNDGMTALMVSAMKGNIETAEVLLKHGADVNDRDKYGMTALSLAENNGHEEIAQFLRSYGAKE